jgi:hypothetical protein
MNVALNVVNSFRVLRDAAPLKPSGNNPTVSAEMSLPRPSERGPTEARRQAKTVQLKLEKS